VVLPEMGAAVVLPGRTLIMLPRGNILVLVFPGGRTFVGGDGKGGPLVILTDVGLEQLVRSGSKLPVSVQCTHHVRVTPSDPSSSQQQEYDTDPVVPRLPTGEVHLMLFRAADTSIGFQNELETNVKTNSDATTKITILLCTNIICPAQPTNSSSGSEVLQIHQR
jgi:hypothetical protein